jgi:hypothetical protein
MIEPRRLGQALYTAWRGAVMPESTDPAEPGQAAMWYRFDIVSIRNYMDGGLG